MADVTVTTLNIFGAAIVDMVVTATPNSTPFASGQNLIVSGAKSDKTDSNGQVVFSDMEAGVYTFTFEGRSDSIQKVVPDSASAYDFVDLDDYTGTNTSLSLPSATYVQRDGTDGFNIGSDATGDIYYRDANGDIARLAVGSDDQVIKASGGVPVYANATGGGDVNGPASSTDGNLPSFSGTGGKTLQDSGVAASSVVTAASTTTFTNKTFDANGTGNALSNVETADIASGSKSGSDATLITGTAGTPGNLAQWNADGDLVDGPASSGDTLPVDDTTAVVQDPADNTKLVRIDAGAISTGTTRVITMGDRDVNLASGGTFAESSHSHAASEITSGTIAHERGGLEADISAYNGLLKVSGGATSQAVAGTDYAAASHNHAGEDITSGTIAAARLPAMVGDSGSGGTQGAVPAPSAGDAAAGKYLDADGTWTVPAGGSGGKLVQRVVGEYSTYYSATGNVIPMDDTIPQNTEGGEVMTQAITPTSSSNKLQIRIYGNWYVTTTSIECAAALFQDTTAGALSAVYGRPAFGQPFVINHNMTAGTTSSTTFKLRVGVGNAAHPVYINGNNSTRLFGGIYRVTMIIDEYET